MLNKRSRMILLEIIKHKSLSIDSLANRMHVSQRTIRMDLDDIDYFLAERNIDKLIRPGKQEIIIAQNEGMINLLYELINNKDIVKASYLPEERLLEELYRIAMNPTELKSEVLAKDMIVSKSTIAKDFDRLKELIRKEPIHLQGNLSGMSIVGDEFEIRRSVVNLYIHNMDKSDTVDMSGLIINGSIKIAHRVYWHLFENVDLLFIKDCISVVETMLVVQLSDIEFLSLGAHLCMMYKRIRMNYLLKDREIPKDNLKGIVDILFNKFKRHLNINIPSSEQYYLYYAIQSISIESHFEIDKIEEDNILTALKRFVRNLNVQCKEAVGNEQLYQKFLKEMRLVYAQNKLSIPIRKNVVTIRGENYQKQFELVKKAITGIEYFKDYSEDALWLLAYHLIDFNLYEKRVKKPKILIVSNKASALTNLLKYRLISLFDVEVVACVGLIRLAQTLKALEVDYIVTTMRLDAYEKPTITIHPLMSGEDVKQLKEFLKTYTKPTLVPTVHSEILRGEHLCLNADFGSVECILNALFSMLKKSDSVYDNYYHLLKVHYEGLTQKNFFKDNIVLMSVQIPETSKCDAIALVHLKDGIVLPGCKDRVDTFITISAVPESMRTNEILKCLNLIREEENLSLNIEKIRREMRNL